MARAKPKKGMTKKSATVAGPKKAATRPTAKRIPARADKAEGEEPVLAKIHAMPGEFAAIGLRLHQLIRRSAPRLEPQVRYGAPMYVKGTTQVCFFRATKNYLTFGFTQDANLTLEEGTPQHLVTLGDLDEARVAALVRKAAL